MKRNGKQHIFGWLAAIMLISLSACTKDDLGEDTLQPEGTVKVKFTIQLPGTSIPTTRALFETDEYKVNEIDVLLFKGGIFEAAVSGSEIKDGNTLNQKTFRVKLDEGTYNLVIIANAHSIIAGATLVKGTTAKADALAGLIAEMPADGKWLTDTDDSNYKHIPMWGDVGTLVIDEDTPDQTGSDAILLTRMLAKVDVKVTATNFELTSVYVYNYHTKGRVVPDNAPTYVSGYWRVATPTLSTDWNVTPGPLSYTTFNNDGNCVGEIYIFEAENHTGTPHDNTTVKTPQNRTCIVVGGKYNGGAESFYRLDFIDDSGNYLDILRNHHYEFTITSVSAMGHISKDIAFKNDPQVNITSTVKSLDASWMRYVIFNGQETLGISEEKFEFTAGAITGEQSDNVLYVQTDVSSGWSVESRVDAADGTTPVTWVTFLPGNDSADRKGKTKVQINRQANPGPADRSAKVWIVAGRLRYPITVTQAAP